MNFSTPQRRGLAFLLLSLALFVLILQVEDDAPPSHAGGATHHVEDRAGLLSDGDRKRFEEYLAWVQRESDVDMRFVFLPGSGAEPLDKLTARLATEMGIGRKTGDRRGLLLAYDAQEKQLRIETGYGLEGVLPDAFLAHLMRDHAAAYFSGNDVALGLRLLVRLIHQRIREAVLGRRFDPQVLDTLGKTGWLSGGAGAGGEMRDAAYLGGALEATAKSRFVPQASPEAAYRAYLEWLALGVKDADIELFTAESRRFVAGLPLSRAYFEFILYQEYGRAWRVEERGNLALLTFTDDPLVSPHFFVKSADGWRIDLVAEVRNTRNRVGGVYIWDYSGKDDEYSKAFADHLVKIKGYLRLKDGDNRELPIRGEPSAKS